MSWLRAFSDKFSKSSTQVQPFPDTRNSLQDLEGGAEEEKQQFAFHGGGRSMHGSMGEHDSDMRRRRTVSGGGSAWGTAGGAGSDQGIEAGLSSSSGDASRMQSGEARSSLYSAVGARRDGPPLLRRLSMRIPEYPSDQILQGPSADLQGISNGKMRTSSFTSKAPVPALAADHLQQPDQQTGGSTQPVSSSNNQPAAPLTSSSQQELAAPLSDATTQPVSSISQPDSSDTATPQPSSQGASLAASLQPVQPQQQHSGSSLPASAASLASQPVAAPTAPNLMPPPPSIQKPASKPMRPQSLQPPAAAWPPTPGPPMRPQAVPPSPGAAQHTHMLPPRPVPPPPPAGGPTGGSLSGRTGPMWGGPLIRMDAYGGPGQQLGAMRSAQSFTSVQLQRAQPPRFQVVPYAELRFIQQIGEGGFGKVFYGHHRGVPVAIKVAAVKAGCEAPANLVAEFTREVTTMSSIPPCPYVLRLVAACTDPPALVTEYCARGSLYSLLHNPSASPMPMKQLMNIWLGVARGMAHLHSCKPPVLHRDLKSANLLLDDMGSVRIADFGLSRFYQDVQALTGGLGTYQWMAPEVLAHQKYSARADVYSFGIVMWECLTRALPYAGMTAVQAAVGVVNSGLRPDLPADTPPDLASLIRACWAPVPDQRPGFEEICGALQGMLGPDMAPPPPPAPKERRVHSAGSDRGGAASRAQLPGAVPGQRT